MGTIDGLPPIRDLISRHKLSAIKSLGQNFILDLNLTSKIARQAGELTNFDVLEIGAGPGGLTRGILAEGARHIVAIEKDKRCISILEEIAEAHPGRLTVVKADALSMSPVELLKSPIKVISNLPYNVGTELFTRWLTTEKWPPFWSSLTLMFQKEVAQRITAKVGSKAYGRLAIMSQWRTDAKIVMALPASSFIPPPKVSSCVVNITALNVPRYCADQKTLELTVARAFNQRRKMLRSSLKGFTANIEKKLEESGINPSERAERVTLEQFCSLARKIKI